MDEVVRSSRGDEKHAVQTVGLRHLDWRFLLSLPAEGAFQHLVLLGGSEELAERIIEVGLARRVSRSLPSERSADAVIVLHPAQAAPGDIAACLVAGGAFYYEIKRPSHLIASLQACGLSLDGLFWVRPNFASRQAYIPLNVPGALPWYLRTFFAPTTTAQRLLEPVIQGLARYASQSFSALVACCAITGTAGSHPYGRPTLSRHPTLPLEWQGADVQPILLLGGSDANRVALFPFAAASIQPLLVLKGGRHPERNHAIDHEQSALTQMRRQLDVAMRQTLPQPLGVFAWGDLRFGIESCSLGRLLATSSHRLDISTHQHIDNLRLVASWLTQFSCQVQMGRPAWASAELYQWVDKPIAAYQQAFGATVHEERLFTAVRQWAMSLLGVPLPMVWVHWGFEERNIFRHGRDISVVDWEGASLGPPLYDLLYFVTRWSYAARELHGAAEQTRGFRELFLNPANNQLVVKAAREGIDEYMTRLDIDPRFLPLFLVLTWLERALGRFQQGAKMEQGRDARRGNAYVDIIGLLAEHQEELFREDGRLW